MPQDKIFYKILNKTRNIVNDSKNFPAFQSGEVWLIGAGPGDPGLLTLHAVKALEQADYILYDALVSQECLTYAKSFAKSSAIFESVGKRAGKLSKDQNSILNQMLILAKKNLRVLRFKGGDPCFFGRGTEEALFLQKENIPYRIIPGITSGLAAFTYAGISLTHRDINQNILFLTGHNAKGQLPDFQWNLITNAAPILVFYMGLRFLGEIIKKLLQHGRDPLDDIILISNATKKEQKILSLKLKDAADYKKFQFLQTPIIIVIGQSIAPCLNGLQVLKV